MLSKSMDSAALETWNQGKVLFNNTQNSSMINYETFHKMYKY